MYHRYESQPFQIVRQIHNFSPIAQGATGLKERNDFNNVSQNFFRSGDKLTEKTSVCEKNEIIMDRNRSSYLHAPIRKIWESDWTLLIPETHKENGNIF
jgi:hypothetical protein